MTSSINILTPKDIETSIISFFKNNSIVPIIGSGFSCGLSSLNGIVPNGSQYKAHMISELLKEDFSDEEKEEISKGNFSTLCDYYEDDENVSPEMRRYYLKNNFYKVFMSEGDVRSSFFKIEWPYIYTLNIDDTIENSSTYKKVILPNRGFNEEIFSEEKCVIKLHGDIGDIITYKGSAKIFTSKEYALSLEKNAPLLNKLRNDYKTQNILFIGCSLDDEIDLKTLSGWPFDHKEKDNLSRTMIFIKGQPNKLQKSKYKTYGITDVVCFDTYELMYEFLANAWNEAKKIQISELSMYNRIKIENIPASEIEENQEYFLWNKLLYDLKDGTLKFPYYFITRNLSERLLKNIAKNKVHLIYGSRISGKSYLLADLYRMIRDREVFYFDGRSRITQKALEKLLLKSNIVALFDVGALERSQFEFILQKSRDTNKKSNNIIINVNNNDSDTFGIVKWKLKQQIIDSSDIITYSLENKFDEKEEELNKINKVLPVINLPPYNVKRSLLDQLIYAERMLQKKGKYSTKKIMVENPKQLALLLLLAIKEKMYSSDIINYGLDFEISMALKYYDPFIERIETVNYEKDASDLSRIKYILNSPYWLKRELGNYARSSENYLKIGEAYIYIIKRIMEFSGHNIYKRRRSCRDLILFDIMNEIFLDEYHGNLKLIVYVYTALQELLADDFHFLHQKAKCYLNYAYFLKNQKERLEYLEKAWELSTISKAMIENEYDTTHNERLQITLAHTQYTRATIACGICVNNDYCVEDVETAINSITVALSSPYNGEDYQKDRAQKTSYGIFSFLNYCVKNYSNLTVSEDCLNKVNDLVPMIIK